jgi:integrase
MKRDRKKEKNIFTEIDKRYGRVHTVVSKSWPDGERFRRRCPNLMLARNLLARINGAIVAGTWKELRKELTEPAPKEAAEESKGMTIDELSDIYLRDYCQIHNTRPDFKEHALKPIREYLGEIAVQDFRRSHAYDFQKELREDLLGHRDLATTQRYVHYVAEHAKDAVRQAQEKELARLKLATYRQRATVTTPVELAKKLDN